MRKNKVGTSWSGFATAVAGIGISTLLAGPAWATCSGVTYTFSNGTTADAGQVNQDFTDLKNCVNAGGGGNTFTGTVTVSGGAIQTSNSGNAADFTTTVNSANALNVKTLNSSDSFIVFYNAGSYSGQYYPDPSTGYATFATPSDERLKDTSVPQRDYRPIIQQLQVVDFAWKKNGAPGFGLIAQQAYTLFPLAVQKPNAASDT